MSLLLIQLHGSVVSDLELEGTGLLPAEVLVGEVAILGGLEVDGLSQVKILDNDSRTEIEVGADDGYQLVRGLVRGAVGVNKDGKRLSDTDGVRELDKSTAGKFGVDEGLGDPSSDVGSRTVDLGEVLSRESTTSVGSPSTVGVNNDLAASQTSITLGSTNDEETRGLDL